MLCVLYYIYVVDMHFCMKVHAGLQQMSIMGRQRSDGR